MLGFAPRQSVRHVSLAPTFLLIGSAVAAVLTGLGCSEEVRIAGSSCTTSEDCRVHPSCAFRAGGCSCRGGVCYQDTSGSSDPWAPGCRRCHGSLQNPAPPLSLDGGESSSELAVGAHQSHLAGGSTSRPVSCSECHQVPQSVDEPGHLDSDLPAEVSFGALSSTKQALGASWDRAAGSCINYCHGASLNGGTNVVPSWTRVDGTEAACGSCHGLPPGGDHPPSQACELCHLPTAGLNKTIANRATHVDGVVQTTAGGCGSCHGSSENAAPPRGTRGESETSQLAVGAHQRHLRDGAVRLAVDCTECHLVPPAVEARGHIDGEAAVTFGALARASAAAPSWDRASASCASSYCHGNFPGGARASRPAWTKVDGTFSRCDSCHGNPPPAPHPPAKNCNACHPETVTVWGAIDVSGGKHLDGKIDLAPLQCTSCHGDPATGSSAPPLGIRGETETSSRAVGAHSAHLEPSAWRRQTLCTDCHLVPTAQTHADGKVEVAFGGPAKADGAAPSYSGTQASCANVYCHGNTLLPPNPGETVKRTPVWTQVDGSFNACGSSCHTNPPGGSHPRNGQCSSCHGAVVDASGVIASGALHVNGTVEVNPAPCNSCHGSAANSAPPVSTTGASSTSSLEVGAHQKHLADGSLRKAVACGECHQVPAASGDPGHLDPAPSEVVFGALGKTGGATPAWNRASASCSGSYCHGATLGGGTLKNPIWTTVNGSQVGCGSCHGNPPPPPHPANATCNSCHPATVNAQGNIDVAGGRHIDGKADVVGSTCTSCHGSPATSDPAPPLGTKGETATSSAAVGAHRTHLTASGWHRQGQCTDCHLVPSSTNHSNGSTELSFGGPATAGGANPSYNQTTLTCDGSYCHGATLLPPNSGSVLRSPVWTQVNGTFSACGTACHTNPPGGTHVANSQCSACHGAVMNSSGGFANPALHGNGVVEVSVPACNSCHGSSANNAPPVSTSGATSSSDLAVGAHQRHLLGGSLRSALSCNECHLVPATPTQAGHLDAAPTEVTFGNLAKSRGASPAWSRASASCSGSYCHGATLGGGTNTTPVWTTVNGTQARCGTCHGNPPPAPHRQFTSCNTCHPGTVTATGAINLSSGLHINGTVEQVPVHPPPSVWSTRGSGNFHGDAANRGLGACTGCHGTNLDGGGAGVSCEQCHAGWKGSCTFCHGGKDNLSGAPPVDLSDRSATTETTVGAHSSHLGASHAISSPIACGSCHTVPADALSSGHIDSSPAEVVFGSLARTGGAAPSWNRSTASCGSVYCHGKFSGGNSTNAPLWTQVNGSQAGCGACHPAAPSTARHNLHRGKGIGCDACHYTVANASGSQIVTPGLHVNGVKDVRLKNGGSWSASSRSCTPSGCHGSETW